MEARDPGRKGIDMASDTPCLPAPRPGGAALSLLAHGPVPPTCRVPCRLGGPPGPFRGAEQDPGGSVQRGAQGRRLGLRGLCTEVTAL